MSVIVMGMEMPDNCYDCPFVRASWGDDFYCAKGNGTEDDIKKVYSKRMDDCPLIEVHTPHGRLIDADFEEQHYTSMTTNPTPDVTEQDKHNSLVIVRALQMAKTVIEAEGSEE